LEFNETINNNNDNDNNIITNKKTLNLNIPEELIEKSIQIIHDFLLQNIFTMKNNDSLKLLKNSNDVTRIDETFVYWRAVLNAKNAEFDVDKDNSVGVIKLRNFPSIFITLLRNRVEFLTLVTLWSTASGLITCSGFPRFP
jgi:hypothetical protein